MCRTATARVRAVRRLVLLAMGGLVVARGIPAAADDVGKQLFLRYCSACHGESGKGDGVVSQLMTPKPTDLTQLAKKAGGKFPFYDVVHAIDGRETVRAHGDSAMPVWGEAFKEEEHGALGAEAVTRSKAVVITSYVETLQK